MKDLGGQDRSYRGQKAQKEIWKFDAALMKQLLHTLKQAAIEVGPWGEKPEQDSAEVAVPSNIEIVIRDGGAKG